MVGKTTQRLEARIKQHVPAVLTKTARTTTSAIGEHLFPAKRSLPRLFDCKMFTIVCHACSDSVQHVLEALYFKKIKPDLCKEMELIKCLYLFP